MPTSMPWHALFLVLLVFYVIILFVAMQTLVFRGIERYAHSQTQNMTFGRKSRPIFSDGHGFYLPPKSSNTHVNSTISPFTYQMHCKANQILNVSDEVLMIEDVLPSPALLHCQKDYEFQNLFKVSFFKKN
uniref:ATP synthase F0 subunit 8 n=1 Tax=Ditylenchus dipsaci TaxID=166011 RepID=A0A915EFJ8_9BILA